jgi:hypothetical protein
MNFRQQFKANFVFCFIYHLSQKAFFDDKVKLFL